MTAGRWLPWLVVLLLGAGGCQRGDPLDRRVSVNTLVQFATWRWEMASEAPAELRRRIVTALLEIRLQHEGERYLKRTLGEDPPVGEEIDEAIRRRINGLTVGEVLQLGYELRVRRLKTELTALEHAMAQNANLVTRPDDLESKQHLEGLRDRQQQRVDTYRTEIAEAEATLAPLQAHTGKRLLPEEPDAPAVRKS